MIGKNTYIGMGSSIIDHLNIGKNCVIAAGAVVTKDLPDNITVSGVPATIKKHI